VTARISQLITRFGLSLINLNVFVKFLDGYQTLSVIRSSFHFSFL
jgi:hypothetical protein